VHFAVARGAEHVGGKEDLRIPLPYPLSQGERGMRGPSPCPLPRGEGSESQLRRAGPGRALGGVVDLDAHRGEFIADLVGAGEVFVLARFSALMNE